MDEGENVEGKLLVASADAAEALDALGEVLHAVAELVEASVPRVTIVPPVPLKAEPTITKRFALRRSEDAELNGLLLRLQEEAKTKVPLGLLVRAALWVLMEREESLLFEARGQTFQLPSTHDRLGQGEFEERWRTNVRKALR